MTNEKTLKAIQKELNKMGITELKNKNHIEKIKVLANKRRLEREEIKTK